MTAEPPPSAQALREAFDAATPYSVGIEDEVMLLDLETFELAPRAEEVLARVPDDPRFKLELPASQVEVVTPPAPTVPEAIGLLKAGRAELAKETYGLAALGSAGAHPFSPGTGPLNPQPRYQHTVRHYGPAAERQLVCAFQIHVAVGDADRALRIYNAARSYLPLLAALAANAPFYEGRDSGLASVRPKLSELLTRHGVPPLIDSWEHLAEDLAWGARAGLVQPGAWWWELRPHHRFGTLEFRVPDGQSTLAEAAALAAVAQTLVAWLDERVTAGERLTVAPSWRIAENRWSACHRGVEGEMVGLEDGTIRPTRECLAELLSDLAPAATRLGCADELHHAGRMVSQNGAILQREAAAELGIHGLGRWLADRFLASWPG